jgi:hypothetical protein
VKEAVNNTRINGLRRAPPKGPWWRLPALAFGLLIVVALCLDLQRFARQQPQGRSVVADLQQIVLGESGGVYAHSNGWFTVHCPAGWRMRVGAQSAPYQVVMYGPAATDISIMVNPVSYDRLPALMRDIERSEEMAGLNVPKEPVFFKGNPAVRRVARLKTQTLLAIDFVKDGLAHHIMCGLPPEHFEKYQAAMFDWLIQHYEPGAFSAAAADGSGADENHENP